MQILWSTVSQCNVSVVGPYSGGLAQCLLCLTEPLLLRQLAEEGMVQRVAQRDPLRRLVLQHPRDQVEQLSRLFTVVL